MRSLIVTLFVAGAALGGASGQARMNFIHLKQDGQVFEKIVDERIKLNFKDPFALAAPAQAVYLQGYGISVSFHLRVNRTKIRLPFGEVDAPSKMAADQIEKEVQKVEQILIECLSTNSATIRQLNAHDKISISAQIEDRNELDPALRRKVLVVTTTKDDAQLLGMQRITPQEFRERLHVLHY